MGLWFFLSDWVAGTSTWGALFRRMMINALAAGGLIFALALLQAPAGYAFAVVLGMFALNGLISFFFLQLRR